jgi:hypothetical protein
MTIIIVGNPAFLFQVWIVYISSLLTCAATDRLNSRHHATGCAENGRKTSRFDAGRNVEFAQEPGPNCTGSAIAI